MLLRPWNYSLESEVLSLWTKLRLFPIGIKRMFVFIVPAPVAAKMVFHFGFKFFLVFCAHVAETVFHFAAHPWVATPAAPSVSVGSGGGTWGAGTDAILTLPSGALAGSVAVAATLRRSVVPLTTDWTVAPGETGWLG